MSIERDLRALLSQASGMPPDEVPDVAKTLARAALDHIAATEEPHVRSSTAPFFASDATGCSRQTAYKYLSRTIPGAPTEPNPPSIADEWRFAIGNAGHDIIQAPLTELHPDSVEVRAVLPGPDGQDLVSSRADLFAQGMGLLEDGTLVELKTAGGYKFKMMATDFKSAPEGPSWAYVTQLALTAKALTAQGKTVTRGVVVVLAIENLSKGWKGVHEELDRFCAQWSFTPEELDQVADKALYRLGRIKEMLEAGDMPPRNIDDPALPKRAIVESWLADGKGSWVVRDPKGEITRGGTTWLCQYCAWRDQCQADAVVEAAVEVEVTA